MTCPIGAISANRDIPLDSRFIPDHLSEGYYSPRDKVSKLSKLLIDLQGNAPVVRVSFCYLTKHQPSFDGKWYPAKVKYSLVIPKETLDREEVKKFYADNCADGGEAIKQLALESLEQLREKTIHITPEDPFFQRLRLQDLDRLFVTAALAQDVSFIKHIPDIAKHPRFGSLKGLSILLKFIEAFQTWHSPNLEESERLLAQAFTEIGSRLPRENIAEAFELLLKSTLINAIVISLATYLIECTKWVPQNVEDSLYFEEGLVLSILNRYDNVNPWDASQRTIPMHQDLYCLQGLLGLRNALKVNLALFAEDGTLPSEWIDSAQHFLVAGDIETLQFCGSAIHKYAERKQKRRATQKEQGPLNEPESKEASPSSFEPNSEEKNAKSKLKGMMIDFFKEQVLANPQLCKLNMPLPSTFQPKPLAALSPHSSPRENTKRVSFNNLREKDDQESNIKARMTSLRRKARQDPQYWTRLDFRRMNMQPSALIASYQNIVLEFLVDNHEALELEHCLQLPFVNHLLWAEKIAREHPQTALFWLNKLKIDQLYEQAGLCTLLLRKLVKPLKATPDSSQQKSYDTVADCLDPEVETYANETFLPGFLTRLHQKIDLLENGSTITDEKLVSALEACALLFKHAKAPLDEKLLSLFEKIIEKNLQILAFPLVLLPLISVDPGKYARYMLKYFAWLRCMDRDQLASMYSLLNEESYGIAMKGCGKSNVFTAKQLIKFSQVLERLDPLQAIQLIVSAFEMDDLNSNFKYVQKLNTRILEMIYLLISDESVPVASKTAAIRMAKPRTTYKQQVKLWFLLIKQAYSKTIKEYKEEQLLKDPLSSGAFTFKDINSIDNSYILQQFFDSHSEKDPLWTVETWTEIILKDLPYCELQNNMMARIKAYFHDAYLLDWIETAEHVDPESKEDLAKLAVLLLDGELFDPKCSWEKLMNELEMDEDDQHYVMDLLEERYREIVPKEWAKRLKWVIEEKPEIKGENRIKREEVQSLLRKLYTLLKENEIYLTEEEWNKILEPKVVDIEDRKSIINYLIDMRVVYTPNVIQK